MMLLTILLILASHITSLSLENASDFRAYQLNRGFVSKSKTPHFQIIANMKRGKDEGAYRMIFILLESKDFRPDILASIFTNLAKRYKQPKNLDITAFSNRAMLYRIVQYERDGYTIEFKDTPEGKKAAEAWAKRLFLRQLDIIELIITELTKEKKWSIVRTHIKKTL